MNQQQYETVKSAAENIDKQVTDAVYPHAFVERWGQLGMPLPKSAAERDTLIRAAFDVSRAKAAQFSRGGVASPIARIADMAKRAAVESGVDSPVSLEGYDLSAAVGTMQQLFS